MSHETRPDKILIAMPIRRREWWNACKGCSMEFDQRKCVGFNTALESLRGYGCTTRERWIRPA